MNKYLKKILSFFLTAQLLLQPVAASSAAFSGQEAGLPAMQRQDDFTYEERLENEENTTVRMRSKVDLNWRFHLGEAEGAEAVDFDDSSWRLLNLPHDWTIEGEYDKSNPSGVRGGYLPGGVGWYRKELTVPDAWRTGKKLYLEFDGVFRNSEVYADGQLLGKRPYGWISFAYDITDYVKDKNTVEIAVRVDNSLEPAARWYYGSGIYSHVYLLSTDEVHVDRHGTYVTTPEVSEETACVKAEITIKNDAASEVTATVRNTIYSPDGTQAAQMTGEAIKLAADETQVFTQEIQVDHPALWDTEHPNLYRLYTEIMVEDEIVDDYETTFGIRSISFSNTEGFFLNGKNMKLKGACDHWAAGSLGAALSENIVRYRLQMLKEMGLNAVRTSHNPRPGWFYDICDEMGILVMDEAFDGWKNKAGHDYGAHDFKDWWKIDVEEWVKRDRNHPSVIIWSIGNETGTEDINGIAAFIETMDSTRGTTGGSVEKGVSIIGGNGGSEVPDFQQKYPELPFVST